MHSDLDPQADTLRHSVWLMPCAADEAALTAIVARLAARFGSPQFQPHLTMAEDMPRSVADLTAPVAAIAAAGRAFTATITAIAATDAFFRSLYAAFEPKGELAAMKERTVGALQAGALTGFVPHISLAYGPIAAALKVEAQVELAASLVGRPIRFDRLCIVRSAQSIPIADWRIERSCALPPARD